MCVFKRIGTSPDTHEHVHVVMWEELTHTYMYMYICRHTLIHIDILYMYMYI